MSRRQYVFTREAWPAYQDTNHCQNSHKSAVCSPFAIVITLPKFSVSSAQDTYICYERTSACCTSHFLWSFHCFVLVYSAELGLKHCASNRLKFIHRLFSARKSLCPSFTDPLFSTTRAGLFNELCIALGAVSFVWFTASRCNRTRQRDTGVFSSWRAQESGDSGSSQRNCSCHFQTSCCADCLKCYLSRKGVFIGQHLRKNAKDEWCLELWSLLVAIFKCSVSFPCFVLVVQIDCGHSIHIC